jgi:hypothetical protein
MKSTILALAAGALVIHACSSGSNTRGDAQPPDSSSPVTQEPMSDSTTFRASGTIHAVNLEGGCWRFDAEDGRHFEISKATAPAGLLVDGKQATLTLRPRSDLMSTCMIGPIAEVVTVEP